MEKKINLDELFEKYGLQSDNIELVGNLHTKLCMLEFGRQLLELASENAECEEGAIVDFGFEIVSACVDKQSILDTLKQVE